LITIIDLKKNGGILAGLVRVSTAYNWLKINSLRKSVVEYPV